MAPASEAEPEPEPAKADPQDELKRKFREALDRKQGRQADKVGGDEAGDGSRVAHAHGPAGGRRTFRRRAGG